MSKKNEPVLPPDYKYHKLSYKTDDYTFAIKEVVDQETAEAWLKTYSKLTKTDWRVERTYSSAGKFVIFKKDYRCCHFTDRRVRGVKSSKHTGCPAKLNVLISVYNEKSKRPNHLAKLFPCTVRLKNPHNHSSDYSEIYAANLAASFKCRRKKPKPKEVIYVSDGVAENLGWPLPLPAENASDDDNNSGCNDVDFSSDIENGGTGVNENATKEEIIRCAEQTDAISGITEIFKRMEKGIRSNPDTFLPAAKKMLQNAGKYGATDAGLVTAMHTFAAYKVVQRALKSKKNKGKRKVNKASDGPNKPRKNRKAPVNPMSPRKNNCKPPVNPMNPRPPEMTYEPYAKFGPACAERVNPFNPRPPEIAMDSYGQFEAARTAGPGWTVPPNQPNAYATGGNYSMPYVM